MLILIFFFPSQLSTWIAYIIILNNIIDILLLDWYDKGKEKAIILFPRESSYSKIWKFSIGKVITPELVSFIGNKSKTFFFFFFWANSALVDFSLSEEDSLT